MTEMKETMGALLDIRAALTGLGGKIAAALTDHIRTTKDIALECAGMIVELLKERNQHVSVYFTDRGEMVKFLREAVRSYMGEDYPPNKIEVMDENGNPVWEGGKIKKMYNPAYVRIDTLCNATVAQFIALTGEFGGRPEVVWEGDAEAFYKKAKKPQERRNMLEFAKELLAIARKGIEEMENEAIKERSLRDEIRAQVLAEMKAEAAQAADADPENE